MRRSNLLFSAAMALAVGLLAGCSDDLATDPGQEVVDHDQMRYLNVSIVSPTSAGTRTTDSDFQNGSDNENFIKNMMFVFYDANGLPTGKSHTLQFETNAAGDGFTDGSGHIGRIWKSTVPVALSQGENLPAYVMCFVNPLAPQELETASLSAIEGVRRQEVVTTTGYFPMSNSVYYGTSPQGQTNVRLFATPIATNQLYPSEEDAARDMHTVDIYVERYASRITLNLGPGTTENPTITPNTTDVNGYTLTFVPEYWRPNAIDQDIFAIKRFGLIGTGGIPNYDPSYNDLLTNFNGNNWWNDSEKYRSYWGCSPSYYTNKYPKVSDDITDVVADNNYPADRSGYPFDLHYFNYTQIAASKIENGSPLQKSVAWDATNGFNKAFYARETTTASSAWGWGTVTDIKGYNPLATLPSVVIVGHYQLAKTGTGVADVPSGRPSFYLYGRTNKKYNLYFDSNIVQAMVDRQNAVLKKNVEDGITSYVAYRETAGFVVEHPSKAVRGIKNTVVPGRHVALQISKERVDAGTLPELYFYDATKDEGNRYVRIDATTINQVNSDLLSAGYATKYGECIGYYNIPVEHLGIYNQATGDYLTDAKESDNGNKYNYKKCPPGAFGIVRNHTYTINVTKISGLAHALRDKIQPIVPPVEEMNYEISARLNILSWRIVPEQEVEL